MSGRGRKRKESTRFVQTYLDEGFERMGALGVKISYTGFKDISKHSFSPTIFPVSANYVEGRTEKLFSVTSTMLSRVSCNIHIDIGTWNWVVDV